VEVQYHGATSRYEVQVEGHQVLTLSLLNGETDEAALPRRGDTVRVAWAREAMVRLEQGG
jgi:putative spermidine/putrescine transport system ATP-binding protein